ncbi:AraC family transcriptional regulator (plasmid) [Methylobacterium currus]|uniref:AraC family transcriptional regulator n=1 Tax=Methylobacterium currus TaxID=2051553 RepID=UPI001E4ACACF|nr:AraC family transcriptional regulator [Methylobacterium currus]UHC20056.1 AraC family transcriptional regulator [Methylobacterium currus]
MTDVGEDALSGLAPLLRVRPQLDDVCHFGGTWTARHEAEPAGQAYFHIVTRGHAILHRPGDAPLHVEAGDILLLPRGDAHAMGGSQPSAQPPVPLLVRNQGSLRFKTSLGVEPEVELICGRLRFEAAPQSLIVAALPDLIVLRVGAQPLALRFHPLLVGIREELAEERAGALAIAENLASALFMLMLRTHLEGSAPAEGLLRLLGQRITAQAVLAMVRDPVRAWTLDDLAEVSAASRATLVRAFRKAAGMPPLEFLSDLRLGLAHHRLRTASASLDEIAAEAGYQSPGAFSRAFLRKYGVRPGRARQESPSSQEMP